MENLKIKFKDFSEYQLGILWGIASISENRIIMRHREKYYLEAINSKLNNIIYSQKDKNEIQYVLKSNKIDIDSFKKNNWTERNSRMRQIPILGNYKDFLRAYIEIHSTLDYSTRYANNKRTKYKALRLRIYGNWKLIADINDIISNNIPFVSAKKPQKASNEVTNILYFSSCEEIVEIYKYIYGSPNNKKYWSNVIEKLKTPRKDY